MLPAPRRRPLRCLHWARCGVAPALDTLRLRWCRQLVWSRVVSLFRHADVPPMERLDAMLAQVQLVDDSQAALVERERALLTDALALLDEVCPEVGSRWGQRCTAAADKVMCGLAQWRMAGHTGPSSRLPSATHRWTSAACWWMPSSSWMSCSCWWWSASSTPVRLLMNAQQAATAGHTAPYDLRLGYILSGCIVIFICSILIFICEQGSRRSSMHCWAGASWRRASCPPPTRSTCSSSRSTRATRAPCRTQTASLYAASHLACCQ